MVNGRDSRQIKRVRNEILAALGTLYPTALQAEHVLRSLLGLFPNLEWDQLRRDLVYLCEKGYVVRVIADTEQDERMTPWRRRWFRLTSAGIEVADRCIKDPALEP